MDLRHFQHAVLLAEELNFGRAAERAHLSQSAFTRSIQMLESEVGLRLFDRGLRHVRVSPVGKGFVDRARALLADAHDLSRELEYLRTGDLGTVSVGAGPFTSRSLLQPVLGELLAAHPGINAKVEINATPTLLDHLKGERIDFFLGDMRSIPPDAGLEVHPIGKFTVAVFCRADHPLLKLGTVTLAELSAFRLALPRLSPMIRQDYHRALGLARGAPPPIALECNSVSMLVAAALDTDLLVAATYLAVRDQLASGKLKVVPYDIVRTVNEISLVRLAGRTLLPAGDRLFAMLLARGKDALTESERLSVDYMRKRPKAGARRRK